jgi:hypothetical protein
MSHLSTIMDRVKARAKLKDYSDPLFEQAVINLMEYIETWTDADARQKSSNQASQT